MTALIDRDKIGTTQFTELYEGGEVWIVDRGTKKEIKLDAKGTLKLLDFLLMHQSEIVFHAHEQDA